MNKIILIIFLLLFSFQAHAVTTVTGKISRVYITPSGVIALQMDADVNFVNTNAAEGNCQYGSFAGADSSMHAAILSARAANQRISLVVHGCETNGWLKIHAIYIEKN